MGKKKILIISLQGIGNTLMTLYAAERLMKKEDFILSMVVSNNGSHELALSVLLKDQVYIWDEFKSPFKNIVHLAMEIRKTYFDEVYLAYPSGKREGMIGLLIKGKSKKVLLDGNGDWRFLRKFCNRRVVKTSKIHNINANFLLFGIQDKGYLKSGQILTETVGKGYGDYAQKFFTENNLDNKFVVAVHPGAKGDGKRWDVQKFIQLCKELNKRFDCNFIIIGGDDELSLKQTIASGIGESAFLPSSSNLFQTASVLSKCNLFIGNDSAPMHLSAVMGTPVIALWSYTDFYRTSPYGPVNTIVRKSYPCSPCYNFTRTFLNSCEYNLKCIKDLRLENVLPVVTQCIENIISNKQDIAITNMNSISIDGLDKIYKLEHGCTVVEFKG